MLARTSTRPFAGAVTTPSEAQIAQEITRQVIARGAGKSICPSEVARALAQDWRALMPDVRRVADGLCLRGEIQITQKGVPVTAEEAKGTIRLEIGRAHV